MSLFRVLAVLHCYSYSTLERLTACCGAVMDIASDQNSRTRPPNVNMCGKIPGGGLPKRLLRSW